jgi:hypothetical protein
MQVSGERGEPEAAENACRGADVGLGCNSGSRDGSMLVPDHLKKGGLGRQGRPTELDRTFCAILSYTKFHVNPPLSSPRTI